MKSCLSNKFVSKIKEKRWSLLYNSEENGLSLNRFQSCLFNYKAPTIMFIYCQSGKKNVFIYVFPI